VSAEAMPPLLQRADLIEAVALLDERLLFVLRAAQVIRDEVPS